MKKIACLSALAAVLAFTAGTSVAATSTVTGGYAQSDAQGQMNKMGGFNLKYRYEEDNSPLVAACYFPFAQAYGAPNFNTLLALHSTNMEESTEILTIFPWYSYLDCRCWLPLLITLVI